MAPGGLPHSEIRGSGAECASPRLIAAYHVLRRLSVPRHPPCALSIFLTFPRSSKISLGISYQKIAIVEDASSDALIEESSKSSQLYAMQLSRCAGGHACASAGPARRTLGTGYWRRGALSGRAARQRRGLPRARKKSKCCLSKEEKCLLPRKEVIQPHLPVRLPCYDFTPLTLHTFDASVPCGFGRRLRVQTTRVV